MLRPVDKTQQHHQEEENLEYSIAEEYHGPPVTYNLRRAIPVDIKHIPTASTLSRTSLSNQVPLPVVHPLVSTHKRYLRGRKLLSSPTSVITFDRNVGQDSASCESSGEYSGNNSGVVGPRIDKEDLVDRSDEVQSSNNGISELELESTEISSARDSGNATPDHADGVPRDWGNVTSDHSDGVSIVSGGDAESLNLDEAEHVNERHEPEIRVKKGLCYRCLKGNRFTAKEGCIVCNVVYCGNCVLRAMGSMPEGRKCLSCIGLPVHESKRESLGKGSKLLKRLLGRSAVQQIMKDERLCEVNLRHAGHFFVNGEQLSQEELVVLQSCAHPPTKLTSGWYWYDRVSGFWGKEGEKPCKIISANLNVGGVIMPNASKGNTGVFINNREITTTELRLLKWAGVQCAGNPHFWLDEFGAYMEEGQKNEQGKLWNKVGIKLVCSVLSLPVPYKVAVTSEVNNPVGGADLTENTVQKLLLVGYEGSGTGTIFKQAKMLYNTEPFSEDERQDIKLIIQRNVYKYLSILLEGRERFEEESLVEIRRRRLLDECDLTECTNEVEDQLSMHTNGGLSVYSLRPHLKSFSDWLIQETLLGNLDVIFPAANREFTPLVEELWKDSAIQATLDRKSELPMLPSVASYFLERVADISRNDYEPSSVDILNAEGLTSSNGLASMDFSFPQSVQHDSLNADDQMDQLLRYQLIRIPTKGVGENFKWLEMFEDAGIVIFCVSLSDYDQYNGDENGAPRNKMLASRKLFEDLITHPTSKEMNFLLVLNKFDLLEEKIEQVPLSQCDWFTDFHPITSRFSTDPSSHNYVASVAEQAFHYIAVQFKRLFNSRTGRKLNVSLVNGLGSESVDEALRYAKEIVKWDEDRVNFRVRDSNYSNETSIYSRSDQ